MKTPIYILEEHNEAFYVWLKYLNAGLIHNNNLLLHFDDHADFRFPVLNNSIYKLNDADEGFNEYFARRELHIDSFIVPAIYLEIINEYHWIRQGVQKTVEAQMAVRTFNNEGKCFLSENVSSAEGFDDRKMFGYIKRGPRTTGDKPTNELRPFLLDIDLDYFSCCENPYIQNEVVIEITEAEYNDFRESPYHYLHFITSNVEAIKYNDSFFYIINSVAEKYRSKREVPEAEILSRIALLIDELSLLKAPGLVTICRSRFSGFTPRHQWEFIEKHLLDSLKKLYNADVANVTSLFRSDIKSQSEKYYDCPFNLAR